MYDIMAQNCADLTRVDVGRWWTSSDNTASAVSSVLTATIATAHSRSPFDESWPLPKFLPSWILLGIFSDYKRRPEGVTPVSWKHRKKLVWDVTVVDSLALANIDGTSQRAGSAAEQAENFVSANSLFVQSDSKPSVHGILVPRSDLKQSEERWWTDWQISIVSMESAVNGEDNETRSEHCADGNEEGSEVEVVNWQQLEDELFAGKSASKHQSRLSNTLNLREEIRRQLASDDAKNGLGMRKSKSGFLQSSSSSEDDDDGELNIEPASENDSTSTEEVDNDKEFYLNHEFTTKVALHKVDPTSKFRRSSKDSRYEAMGYTNGNGKISPHRPADQLVIRPLQNRPSLRTRIQNNKDLQICFLNDLPVKTRPNSSSSGRSSTESTDKLLTGNKVIKTVPGPPILGNNFWSPPDGFGGAKHSMGSFTMSKSQSMFEMESEKQRSDKFIMGRFEEVQAQWRQEMQSKIQIAHQQIHLQAQRQRRRQKKTPITSKIKLPHGKSRLDRALLGDMNVSHLQVITNDLLEQIENLNDGLVRFLEERDELHMEQDSKLVDIDDLSRRLKEQWMMNWRRKTLAFQAANTHKSFEEDAEFLYRNENSDRPAVLAYEHAANINNPTTSSSSAASSSDTSPTLAAMSSASLKNFRQKIRSFLS